MYLYDVSTLEIAGITDALSRVRIGVRRRSAPTPPSLEKEQRDWREHTLEKD